jgi:hypothetical protein
LEIAVLNKTRRASSCGDLSTPFTAIILFGHQLDKTRRGQPTFKVECYNQFVVGGSYRQPYTLCTCELSPIS